MAVGSGVFVAVKVAVGGGTVVGSGLHDACFAGESGYTAAYISNIQSGRIFLTFSTEENYNRGAEGCQSWVIPCTERLFYFIIESLFWAG